MICVDTAARWLADRYLRTMPWQRPGLRTVPPCTFGTALRAARLGYGWSVALQAWVRIVDDGPSGFVVTLAPPNSVPVHNPRVDGKHRCWWDGGTEAETALANAPGLLPYVGRGVKHVVRLTLDDTGRVVRA